MTFAAEEEERVWEKEEERGRSVWVWLTGCITAEQKKKKEKEERSVCLAWRETDRKREGRNIGQRLDAQVFLIRRQSCAFTQRILF